MGQKITHLLALISSRKRRGQTALIPSFQNDEVATVHGIHFDEIAAVEGECDALLLPNNFTVLRNSCHCQCPLLRTKPIYFALR